MIEAIIFDLDGLLVDSERYWNEARRAMAAERDVAWNADDHRACMGVSTRTWANYMIQRLNLELTPEQVEAHIIGKMVELYTRQIPYMPGAIEAVNFATSHNRIGLASGSPRVLIDAVANDAPMRDKFQAIVCSDELPRGKPAPDVYLEAARLLQVEPARCVCLEDSGNGILSGKNAGMFVIAIPDVRYAPPSAEILQQANLVLGSLYDFNLNAIRSLEKS
ncbi:MAG: HAD family phosphatase [Chloroflexi bacterium]|nr:HAD family phosphatase [Chloroflexota bacterium]